jgi:hypothetical protein
VNSASEVAHWDTNVVNQDSTSGPFTNIPTFTPVAFSPVTWPFNSGPISNFWSVGGLTFDLKSSVISIRLNGFLYVTFLGTINGNGFDHTVVTGNLGMSNPSANGMKTFQSLFTFSTVAAPPNLTVITNAPNGWNLIWPATNNYTYTLQQNSDLNTTNWTDSQLNVDTISGTNYCPIPSTSGNLFFRLRQ